MNNITKISIMTGVVVFLYGIGLFTFWMFIQIGNSIPHIVNYWAGK